MWNVGRQEELPCIPYETNLSINHIFMVNDSFPYKGHKLTESFKNNRKITKVIVVIPTWI